MPNWSRCWPSARETSEGAAAHRAPGLLAAGRRSRAVEIQAAAVLHARPCPPPGRAGRTRCVRRVRGRLRGPARTGATPWRPGRHRGRGVVQVKRITWVVASMWLAGVVASCALVILVSAAKGGLLVSRAAPTITVQRPARPQAVDLGPLWVETTACNVGLAEVRWQLEALLPHLKRAKAPTVPRGARPPTRASRPPVVGSALVWQKAGWDR